jgi:choline-sulfatase
MLGDDHAAYALGCYGSEIARTPNLDALAARGVRFTRAYANSPVCTPSRQSLLTGRLPHAVGVTLLSTPLGDEALTLAEVLKAGGYRTAAFGKMHFNSDLRHGFDTLVDRAEHRARLRGNPPPPLPEGTRTLGAWRPFRDPAREWLNASYLPGSYLSGTELSQAVRAADMDGTFFAREAARFLAKAAEAPEEPFFLVVSFHEPHSPFHFPLELAGLYDPDKLPLPVVAPEDPPQVPLIFRDLTDAEKRRIAASYYTSVAYLDRNVGLVLDALETNGHAATTLVIYAGDHGYTLGHHGRFEKHCFWEEAVRAPLVLRWPGRVREGEASDALVELVDVFPTVVEACGLALPEGLHGRSLLPLAGIAAPTATAAADTAPRDHVVSQYHENEEAMVRTADWKLIRSSGRRERRDGYKTDKPTPGRYRRLYDLRGDPGETRDRSSDPQHAKKVRELERLLLERLESTAPTDGRAPAALDFDERLDWYLVPPETRSTRK